MRYRYPAPRLIRRIDIVTGSDLIHVLAASVAESTEPHGIPTRRGTMPTGTTSVPDVCDVIEGPNLSQAIDSG
jgi:hypothetical protein